jgi:hypothetical protein
MNKATMHRKCVMYSEMQQQGKIKYINELHTLYCSNIVNHIKMTGMTTLKLNCIQNLIVRNVEYLGTNCNLTLPQENICEL